jgi:hypothetical protein
MTTEQLTLTRRQLVESSFGAFQSCYYVKVSKHTDGPLFWPPALLALCD